MAGNKELCKKGSQIYSIIHLSSIHTVIITNTEYRSNKKICGDVCERQPNLILCGRKSIKKCPNWEYEKVAKKHAIQRYEQKYQMIL